MMRTITTISRQRRYPIAIPATNIIPHPMIVGSIGVLDEDWVLQNVGIYQEEMRFCSTPRLRRPPQERHDAFLVRLRQRRLFLGQHAGTLDRQTGIRVGAVRHFLQAEGQHDAAQADAIHE